VQAARRPVFEKEPGPFLKWAGGKRQLLGQLAALVPPDAATRRYHEPFLGGGAVYFHLRPCTAFLGDLNTDLVVTYGVLRDDVDALIAALAPLVRKHSVEQYYRVRARFNVERHALWPVERAALFIYLNKTGYNGLWRVNSRGENNVPAGRLKQPRIYDPERLRTDAALLRGARLHAGSFEAVLDRAQSGDLVYLDPPYQPLSRTASFTSYAAGGFGDEDQEHLAEVVGELDRRGCLIMLSNSDCAFIRRLYRGFRIERVKAPRLINSKVARRGPVNELLVRNYS
jgi:DNA adenine methylase